MLLAIDTATTVASVSLYDNQVLAETTWVAGQDQTRLLLVQVDGLLKSIARSVDDVSAVGVGIGPGSFNALRVGIATAKAICVARGIPIVGIETLRAAAYAYRLTFRPIRPLFRGGGTEVVTGLYQASEDLFATVEEPRLTTLEDALASSPEDTLFCGELRPEWTEAIHERFGHDGIVPRPAESIRRAGYLAELAWHQLQDGIVSDVATLQPLYLRRPAIGAATGSTRSTP